jgi:hypothetical protein
MPSHILVTQCSIKKMAAMQPFFKCYK